MLATYEDFRWAAKKRLPRLLFDYVDGGAYAERTLAANVADFAGVHLRQRVLHDVSKLETGVDLFGRRYSMPVILAPVGMAGLYAKRGEAQAARAAAKAGVPMCLSTLSICGLDEVSRTAPPWFQLYVLKDRGFMRELIAKAKTVGSPVLVFTVDLPTPGARYRDVRSGLFGGGPSAGLKLALDGITHPGWLFDVWFGGQPHCFENVVPAVGKGASFMDFWVWVRKNFDPTLTWDDLAWIKQAWGGPIVIKGILDPEDARLACEAGVDGIVVSNHGGRQLDDALSGIRALPGVVEAVDGRATVLMDGGVRSGLDVLKALATGAKACLIGRSWAMALGARGERGVFAMLANMRDELKTAMALTGCTDVARAGPDLLVR
ncbi:MAG: L-lactate dehydrogenase [Hyphomonadaceae bacterium]|nr:L-lactate dehydrogenase [Hyphomonadaceae bacterium]